MPICFGNSSAFYGILRLFLKHQKYEGLLPKPSNVTLNEVKGLLCRRRNEILPPAFGGGQNGTKGLTNSPMKLDMMLEMIS
jgi:hypothetical protein